MSAQIRMILLGVMFSLLFLGGNALGAEEWEKALKAREWEFPRDHGAHPEFKTEWWYFTGHLKSEEGEWFGYQLTFFRQGIKKEPTQKKSQWALRDIYFAHFAITSVSEKSHYFAENISRGSLGTAQYSQERMDILLGKWYIKQVAENSFELKASTPEYELDLLLHAKKPKVFQGKDGLSQKGKGKDEKINASYYYTYTHLDSGGKLVWKGKRFGVSGKSWFDHEFSTGSLAENQVGWDWFSIQLNHGEEIMLYQMRQTEGGIDPYSHGSWVTEDGKKINLQQKDYRIEVIDTWVSPKSGARYPSKWKITVPSQSFEAVIIPEVSEQESEMKKLRSLFYWEGACRVEAKHMGAEIEGRAYVELTGYAKPLSFK